MKRPTPRFSTRTIELDRGYFIIRYKGADVTADTAITIAVSPGENGRAEMMGEVDGGVGHLTTPGSLLLLKVKEPVRLIVTIMTSIKVMKANVRLDVQRLDDAGQSLAPAGLDDAAMEAAVGEKQPSQQAAPSAKAAPASPWLKWEGRPAQVMLSMAVAEQPGVWSPPRLAEEHDLARLSHIWGLRWALVGPGRQEWQLQARSEMVNGERSEVVGGNVAVPQNAKGELRSASLFVRHTASEEWRQIMYWSAG